MNQLAAQLFHEPASPVVTPTSADANKAQPETGRRSFSDKLHEMIRTAEEALCRPPSATNLLAVRAATPPSLQFSAAEIPPKPTTPKPPVVPRPTTPEPDTNLVAGLGRRGSNSGSNILEMRRDSMERRASIASDRRKSLERGLSNAELHQASNADVHPASNAELQRAAGSRQDLEGYVGSLDLKPVLHPMDTFGTSRSTPAMAQEPAIPTDRTAVSEHPMPSDTETPRFDAELELLHNDDMPESPRESEDGTKDESATLEGDVAVPVTEASASGSIKAVPTTSGPDDGGEAGDSDYNDDEFEEAVNESGDASEPPVDVDACAPEVDHDTPRSVVSVDELDSEPPTDVNEPPAVVNQDLDGDETAPGGSEACEAPAAAPLSLHQESETEPVVNDTAVDTTPTQIFTETPTTEQDRRREYGRATRWKRHTTRRSHHEFRRGILAC